jgi:hypothetical protein
MLKGNKMEERTELKIAAIIITIVIVISICIMIILAQFGIPKMTSVKIELDYDHGFHLNFSKMNLSEEAIENISTSKVLIIVDFPEFNKNITYSLSPEFTDINHSIDRDQGSILINNVDKYEGGKEYPFAIHFQIESNNSELRDLIILRGNNSIYGTIRFEISSFEVDFFDGEYIRTNVYDRYLKFKYPPIDLELKFIITKYQ